MDILRAWILFYNVERKPQAQKGIEFNFV